MHAYIYERVGRGLVGWFQQRLLEVSTDFTRVLLSRKGPYPLWVLCRAVVTMDRGFCRVCLRLTFQRNDSHVNRIVNSVL